MKSTINFINNDISFTLIHKKNIREWILNVINEEQKLPGNLTYIFCTDEYLTYVNINYLNSDYLTDIITFDYTEDIVISGDMMISLKRVKENSKLYKTHFLNELHRVMIHGILHLCGYKDKSKKEQTIMRAKEDYYLKNIVNF